MHPDWKRWSLCSVKKWNPLYVVDFMQHDWMQWIPCIMIECSWFYAAWPKASRWNAVDSMQRDWMQCTPCSVVKCIPIKCSGFHAAWWNEVYSIQCEVMEPYCMQWILCSMIECSGFHEASMNARIPSIVAQWILIVCSGVHAAKPKASRLNSVDFMRHGPKHPDGMQWIPCIVIECSVLHSGL